MFRCQPSRLFLCRATYTRTYAYQSTTFRSFSAGPSRCAQKDAQDKDSLNPRSTEYSQSGSDDAAAHTPDAAFNPDKTSPEQEKATAKREGGSDPLEASPGNIDMSKPRKDDEGGAQGSPRTSQSGGGGAPKSGGNKTG